MQHEYKAIYHNGGLRFQGPAPDLGPDPVEVIMIVPEDPWESILNDPSPRPKLAELVDEVTQEIARGEAKPLDPGEL